MIRPRPPWPGSDGGRTLGNVTTRLFMSISTASSSNRDVMSSSCASRRSTSYTGTYGSMDKEPLLMQKFRRKSRCVNARPGNCVVGAGILVSTVDGRDIAALHDDKTR